MSVYLIITSTNVHNERRFDKSLTLTKFKQRLEPITGIPSSNQKLSLYSGETFIQNIIPFDSKSEDEILLGAFYVEDNCRVQVTDVSDVSGVKYRTQFGDLSNVDKYEMEQEEYAKRQDSVLAFKERNRLGRFSETSQKNPVFLEDVDLSSFTLGSRCKGTLSSKGTVGFGTIRFVGKTEFLKEGHWIGIELDEPNGKNDGSVQGVKYFECLQNYGIFLRPEKVEVGDFAKKDILDELEEL